MRPRASRIRGPAVLVLLLIAVPSAAAYGERVFNANLPLNPTQSFPVNSGNWAAQSFTPASSFILQNVTLYVDNAAVANLLDVTIETDAGRPSGTALAASSRGRVGEGWLDLPFASPPTLTSGTRYWIVAKNSALSTYSWFHGPGNDLPGEETMRCVVALNVCTGWSTTSADLVFLTYGLRLEPLLKLGLSSSQAVVEPDTDATFSVYVNNTGSLASPVAWVNLTVPAALTYVADNAVGAVRTGLSWRFADVANGATSFGVVLHVNSNAVSGDRLNGTGHLDYTNSAGVPQAPDTASTIVLVLAVEHKHMYLSFNGTATPADDELRAAPPSGVLGDFDGAGQPGMLVAATGGAAWTLTPAFARPFHLRGSVGAILYLNGLAAGNVDLNATFVSEDSAATRATIGTSLVTFSSDGNLSSWQAIAFDFGVHDLWLAAGNRTRLVLNSTTADVEVAYNDPLYSSHVNVSTDSYVNVDGWSLEDDRGPATFFSGKDNVHILVNVSDPLGSGEILDVRIDVRDPTGDPVGSPTDMSVDAIDPSTPSAWKRYRHVVAMPAEQGEYTFALTATEGNGVRTSAAGAFSVRYPVLALTARRNPENPKARDPLTFSVWINNSGGGPARGWLNGTIPADLAYVSDTSAVLDGNRTGTNWTFSLLAPGPHAFTVTYLVGETVRAGATIYVNFTLTYEDEKGFLWAANDARHAILVGGTNPGGGGADGLPWLALIAVAAAIGVPSAVVLARRKDRIEEVFLILREGVLLHHVSRHMEAEGDKDKDILGAMLTAVQDFVKDSFKYGENRDLNRLEFGDYTVLIQRGKYLYLAVVLSGDGGASLLRRMREVVDEIEGTFGDALKHFDGDIEPLLGVRDVVSRLMDR